MKTFIAMLFAAALVMPAHANAAPTTCGMATLLDVDVDASLVPIPTITTARARSGTIGIHDWYGYTTPGARLSKRYRVTVRLNDMVYTGESSGDGFWTFNPTALVVNDTIHVCVAKDRLRMTRPDGKDYNATIVRAVRNVVADAGPTVSHAR